MYDTTDDSTGADQPPPIARGDDVKPGTQLERRPAPQAPTRPGAEVADAHGRERPRAGEGIRLEFRPSAWLLLAAQVVRLWPGRPRLGKRALAGLAWRLLPRELKLVASGVVAVAFLVLAGSLAALGLVIAQLA